MVLLIRGGNNARAGPTIPSLVIFFWTIKKNHQSKKNEVSKLFLAIDSPSFCCHSS